MEARVKIRCSVLCTTFGLGKWVCPGKHLADAVLFIVIASFLSVFNIKSDGTGGPDKYPFTGSDIRCAHRVSLVMQELTVDFFFLVSRSLSLAPSPQEIRGQKSSLLPMRKHGDLLQVVCLSCAAPFLSVSPCSHKREREVSWRCRFVFCS
jgi:hypothetical protein